MKEPLDNFLEQIKSTLSRHEEAYDEGAWERFAAKNISAGRKPKGMVAPIWKWAAAAAILVGAVFLIQLLNTPGTTKGLQDGTHLATGNDGQKAPSEEINKIIKDSNAQEQTAGIAPQSHNQDPSQLKTTNPSYVTTHLLKSTGTQKSQAASTTPAATPLTPVPPAIAGQQPPRPDPQPQVAPGEKTDLPFYQNKVVPQDMAQTPSPRRDETKNIASITQPSGKAERRDRSGKWLSSLYVSPVFGNDNVNMGYGYQLGYEISDKVSIKSGIAYTKMSTSKNYNTPEPPAMGMAMYSSVAVSDASNMRAAAFVPSSAPSYLQSVDAWVSGIDVPVEVNYNISKKVYASGGVSGLFVLDGKTKETFQDNNVRVTVQSPQDKIKEDKNVALSNPYNNEQPESTPFLGFYNVSMGYKQKVSKKNSVSLEPFIKVPMKQVTQQKLNYTGMGVRLKFDF